MLNLQVNLGKIDILRTSDLPVYEHGITFHLVKSLSFSSTMFYRFWCARLACALLNLLLYFIFLMQMLLFVPFQFPIVCY